MKFTEFVFELKRSIIVKENPDPKIPPVVLMMGTNDFGDPDSGAEGVRLAIQNLKNKGFTNIVVVPPSNQGQHANTSAAISQAAQEMGVTIRPATYKPMDKSGAIGYSHLTRDSVESIQNEFPNALIIGDSNAGMFSDPTITMTGQRAATIATEIDKAIPAYKPAIQSTANNVRPQFESELTRQEANALGVYNAFTNAGFSDAQAKALTAEVNRENSFQDRYLYGTHSDPYNRATNAGMISWQGPRHDSFMNYMRDAGRVDDSGSLIPGQETLDAQAKFVRYEMENVPDYSRTANEFLANPDIDPNTAAEVLGDNYIRWRRTDPAYSAAGYANLSSGYATLDRAMNTTGGTFAAGSYVPPSSDVTLSTKSAPTPVLRSPIPAPPNPFTSIPARVGILPPKFIPKIDVSKLPGPSGAINLRRDYRASGGPLDSVKTLQSGLSTLGYSVGDQGIDGRYGRNTTAAVRQFQQDYGLKVDGIAGVQTLSAMKEIFDKTSLPTRPVTPTPGLRSNTTVATKPVVTAPKVNPTPMGAFDRTGPVVTTPKPIVAPKPTPAPVIPPAAVTGQRR